MEDRECIHLSNNSYIVKIAPPLKLLEDISKNFDALFNKHPIYEGNEKSKILLFNKDMDNPEWTELETHRWFHSYLNTPKFTCDIKKSYMFSSYDEKEIVSEVPSEFDFLMNYVFNIDEKYNQVVINWYENENDYITAHSDWTDGMVENYNIGLLSLYGANDKKRNFKITDKKDENNVVNMTLENGEFVMMCGDFQNEFRHEVEKISDNNCVSRRIGISFRQYKI